MRASHVTRETLEAAAREIGVGIDIAPKGRQFRVKILPAPKGSAGKDADRPGDRKYQRVTSNRNSSGDRRVAAVCWHGFRDYFRAVYRREPGAVFATALDTWKGSEDFETRFRYSGHKNCGSQYAPLLIIDACVCPESGAAC